nr:permease [Halomicroarcula amylolytica]
MESREYARWDRSLDGRHRRLTTTKPLGTFFVESLRQFLSTTVSMGGGRSFSASPSPAWKRGPPTNRSPNSSTATGPANSATVRCSVSSPRRSYSAIATAKTLFKKGSSAAATLGASMFASTNLVIEIGAVIALLLGWQFLAADVVGGFMLIGLMALGFVYPVPIPEYAAKGLPVTASD